MGAEREAILDELETIEASPAFARAPVMRKLLRFLVEEVLAGRGDRLKSYTVAVDGLDRADNFDPQTDSYIRVQMGRLRKMLDAHYARMPATAPRLRIPQGNYAPEWTQADRRDGAAAGLRDGFLKLRRAIFRRRFPVTLGLGLLGAMVLSAFACFIWLCELRPMAHFSVMKPAILAMDEQWPTVAFEPIVPLDGDLDQTLIARRLTDSLKGALSRFDSLRVVQSPSQADYIVRGTVKTVPGGTNLQFDVTNRSSNELIWALSRVHPAAMNGAVLDYDAISSEVSAELGQPYGIIHNYEQEMGADPATRYGCWLAYIELRQLQGVEWGKDTSACAERWLREKPGDPLVHVVHSWLLADRYYYATGATRAHLAQQAEKHAELAVEFGPRNPQAHYAKMRAAFITGDQVTLGQAADRAIALNPNDPDIISLVGLQKIVSGQAGGLEMLQRGLAVHSNPPRWYYGGLVFAKVAVGDRVGAHEAARMMTRNPPMPLDEMALAVTHAGLGEIDAARIHWAKAVKLAPDLANDPEMLMKRWQFGSDLREPAIHWLRSGGIISQ